MKIKQYKEKPSAPFQAIQFTGDNFKEINKFCPNAQYVKTVGVESYVIIKTPDCKYTSRLTFKKALVQKGDWISWQQNNTYHVIEKSEFELFYEEVKNK